MSDFNVTVAHPITLEIPKDGTATPAKDAAKTVESAQPAKPESKQRKSTLPTQTRLTDLNYSIDHDSKALHLKIKSMDGEVVREVVFDRIDPHLLDTAKLKGIFVDGNS